MFQMNQELLKRLQRFQGRESISLPSEPETLNYFGGFQPIFLFFIQIGLFHFSIYFIYFHFYILFILKTVSLCYNCAMYLEQ